MQTTFLSTPSSHLEFAYKHPVLLMEESTGEESVVTERNKEVEYIEDKKTDFENDDEDLEDEISVIIAQPKLNALTPIIIEKEQNSDDDCRLIGKVNPNLIKTWEQLSGNRNEKYKSLSSVNSEKKKCVLFYREQFNFKNDVKMTEKFYFSKILHLESSDDFYDSIDDQSILENTNIVDDIMSSSIYMQQDSDYAAGESMAECGSLEKKKICWSSS